MSSKPKQRKFKTYRALNAAISRAKIEKSGAVSRLLLETFLEDEELLRAEVVVGRGICEDGKFTVWRNQLVKAGWLKYEVVDKFARTIFEAKEPTVRYEPGFKLTEYLNREKIASEEIATVKQVREVQRNVEAIDAKHDEKSADLKEELSVVKAELKAVKEDVSLIKAHMTAIYQRENLGEIDPPDFLKLQNKLATKQKPRRKTAVVQ